MTVDQLELNGEICFGRGQSAREALADFLRERRNLTGYSFRLRARRLRSCRGNGWNGVVVRSLYRARRDVPMAARNETIRREPRAIELMNVIRRHFHEMTCICNADLHAGHADDGARYYRCVIREPSESTIRAQLSGQICRCTGYMGIVDAIKSAAMEIAEARLSPNTAAA